MRKPQILGEALGERTFLHAAIPDTSGCISNRGRLGREGVWGAGRVLEPPAASFGGSGGAGCAGRDDIVAASWQ